MNSKLLKSSILSLLSIFTLMNGANAGKIEISNIDIPDVINGIPMKVSIMLMGKTSNYTSIDIDLDPIRRGVFFSHDIPNDQYPEMIVSYNAASQNDMYNLNAPNLNCRINMGINPSDNNDREIIEVLKDSILAISFSYQPGNNTVTGDVIARD